MNDKMVIKEKSKFTVGKVDVEDLDTFAMVFK